MDRKGRKTGVVIDLESEPLGSVRDTTLGRHGPRLLARKLQRFLQQVRSTWFHGAESTPRPAPRFEGKRSCRLLPLSYAGTGGSSRFPINIPGPPRVGLVRGHGTEVARLTPRVAQRLLLREEVRSLPEAVRALT